MRRADSLEIMVERFAIDLDPVELSRATGAISTIEAGRLPGLLLRTGIVRTMRDDERSARRDAAFTVLTDRLRSRHGDEIAAEAERASSLITIIERGYHALQDELDAILAVASPSEWVWAVIDRAAGLVDWSLGELDRRAASALVIDGSVFALPNGDAADYRADELLAMIDASTSMCVRTLAARHGWHDRDGAIVLPRRPDATSPDVDAAELTRLSEIWEMWRRMETGARFLGCELEVTDDGGSIAHRLSTPRDAMSWRMLAHVAHERLTIEIGSVYNQLIHGRNTHLASVGIDYPAPLMPAAYVTVVESAAYHALDMLLAAAPCEDTSQYLGLTLVEWLRGYSVLEQIASMAGRLVGDASRLLIHLEEADLLRRLVGLGLSADKARRFVRNVTFGRGSGDVVDDPILRIADGRLLLFGPLAVNSEITRVVLSKFSRRQVRIGAKGRRFERRFREHMTDWGLKPVHGCIKDGLETYEIDAAIRLDHRLFLLECKTRSTFGVDPASVRRLRDWMSQTAAQTRRIADGMRRLPDALMDLVGEDCEGIEVVPCVVSAMPLEAPGPIDGVLFTDKMALATFFAIGEAGVYATHRRPGLPSTRQTIFATRLWSGPSPTSDDLLRFLEDPPSVAMTAAHLRAVETAERHPSLGELHTTEIEILPADVSRSVAALGGGTEASDDTLATSRMLKRLAGRLG